MDAAVPSDPLDIGLSDAASTGAGSLSDIGLGTDPETRADAVLFDVAEVSASADLGVRFDAGSDVEADIQALNDASVPDARAPMDTAELSDSAIPDGGESIDIGTGDEDSSAPNPCDDENLCTSDFFDEVSGECVNTYVYGICCTSNAMCDDADPCTEDRCIDELCQHQPSCCTDDSECGQESECAVPACVVADAEVGTNKCVLLPTGNDGCCAPLMFFAGFDDGTLGGLEVSNAFMEVGWQLTENTQANSPPGALWYGSALTGDYDNGTFNSGEARLPPITLPAGVDSEVELDLFLDIEPGFSFDRLEIHLLDIETGVTTVIWDKSKAFLYGGWFTLALPLQAFGGRSVELSIFFDTFDNQENGGQGVFVDNIRITSTCTPTVCAQDADCDDGHAFTDDTCAVPEGQTTGQCVYSENSAYCVTYLDCDDGEPCTFNACVNNECYFAENTACCLSDADCDDLNPCTADDCVGVSSTSGGSCNNYFIPGCCQADVQCNDGEPCTEDLCNLETNLCEYPEIDDCCKGPEDCDDGDPCTEDLCSLGQCVAQNVCCGTDADCDDGESLCTVESCVDGVCNTEFTDAPQCCTITQLFTQFTAGSWGPFTESDDSSPFDGVGWFSLPTGGISSGGVLKYGPLGLGTYDTGAPHSGSVTSYPISLSNSAVHEASFWVRLDTEYANGDGSLLWDRLRLEAIGEATGDVTLVWDSAWGAPQWWEETDGVPTGPVWTFVDALDISALKGRDIRLRFSFDTVDADANAYEGVFIDDVLVFSSCE